MKFVVVLAVATNVLQVEAVKMVRPVQDERIGLVDGDVRRDGMREEPQIVLRHDGIVGPDLADDRTGDGASAIWKVRIEGQLTVAGQSRAVIAWRRRPQQ